jgi:peptide chain release factor 1
VPDDRQLEVAVVALKTALSGSVPVPLSSLLSKSAFSSRAEHEREGTPGPREIRELDRMLAEPETIASVAKIREIGKERAEIEELATAADEMERLESMLEGAREVLAGSDTDLREMAEEEIAGLTKRIEAHGERLRILSIPRDPDDSRNAIIEIRAGTGGEEAALFAAEIYRMYLRFADRSGWKTELLELNETEIGGLKEVVFSLQGEGAYGTMRYESGVHRVQRVPQTESGGRIHTSAVTVAVLPKRRKSTCRSIPPNCASMSFVRRDPAAEREHDDSAVRITHIPTGLVVICQDEKSQLKNKAEGAARASFAAARSRAPGRRRRTRPCAAEPDWFGRSFGENPHLQFPQNRVTDHRIGLSCTTSMACWPAIWTSSWMRCASRYKRTARGGIGA